MDVEVAHGDPPGDLGDGEAGDADASADPPFVPPIYDDFPHLKELCATSIGYHNLQKAMASLLGSPGGLQRTGLQSMQLLEEHAAAKAIAASKAPVTFLKSEKAYEGAHRDWQGAIRAHKKLQDELAEVQRKVASLEQQIVKADSAMSRTKLAYAKSHAVYLLVLAGQYGRADGEHGPGATPGRGNRRKGAAGSDGVADVGDDVEMDGAEVSDDSDDEHDGLGLEGEELATFKAKVAAYRAEKAEYKDHCREVQERRAKFRRASLEVAGIKRRRSEAELAAREEGTGLPAAAADGSAPPLDPPTPRPPATVSTPTPSSHIPEHDTERAKFISIASPKEEQNQFEAALDSEDFGSARAKRTGVCGGAMIIAQAHLSMFPVAGAYLCEDERHMVGQEHDWAAMEIQLRKTSLIILVAYLTNSIGVSGDHVVKMRQIADVARPLKQPLAMVADWNMTPAKLEDSGFFSRFLPFRKPIPVAPDAIFTCTCGVGRMLDL